MNSGPVSLLAFIAALHPAVIISVVMWTLVWKGFALWRAAGLRQKYWFIALLLINTLGILEIIYLFGVARNYKVEIIEQNG